MTLWCLSLVWLPLATRAAEPTYVGARACAACHSSDKIGDQYSIWLHSRHAGAYKLLARPEAPKIAELRGIHEDPREAPACLKCHSTGVGDVPKAATFRREDGVQCEACHGPGSEYMTEAIMSDPEAARAAGLAEVGAETCERCHDEAVHGGDVPFETRMQKITHPIPPPVGDDEKR